MKSQNNETSVALRGIDHTRQIDISRLIKIADKIEEKQFEADQVADQEPIVLAEIEKGVSELSSTIAPEKLFYVNPDDAALDPETSYAVKKLNSLRTKRELIPGVLARLKADLEKLQSDARRLAEEIADDLQEDARVKIEELTVKTYNELLPICGNDVARTRAATKAVIDSSELTKWCNGFCHLAGRASPSELRSFHKYATAYQAGKPIAEVK